MIIIKDAFCTMAGDLLGGLDLKGFLSTFAICLVLCVIATFLFGELLVSNIWADVVAIAFLLAVSITVFMNQDSRIEELEKKIQQLQSGKESSSGE